MCLLFAVVHVWLVPTVPLLGMILASFWLPGDAKVAKVECGCLGARPRCGVLIRYSIRRRTMLGLTEQNLSCPSWCGGRVLCVYPYPSIHNSLRRIATARCIATAWQLSALCHGGITTQYGVPPVPRASS